MGSKSTMIIALTLIIPIFFELDKTKFITSLIIFYFALLIPELIYISKRVNKKSSHKRAQNGQS
jgi:hypothetical protein